MQQGSVRHCLLARQSEQIQPGRVRTGASASNRSHAPSMPAAPEWNASMAARHCCYTQAQRALLARQCSQMYSSAYLRCR